MTARLTCQFVYAADSVDLIIQNLNLKTFFATESSTVKKAPVEQPNLRPFILKAA